MVFKIDHVLCRNSELFNEKFWLSRVVQGMAGENQYLFWKNGEKAGCLLSEGQVVRLTPEWFFGMEDSFIYGQIERGQRIFFRRCHL